ncbi:MAG: Na+:solute symporter [Leptospira sp.]|nr:Na+:solute symporter [Leptospira sp.]
MNLIQLTTIDWLTLVGFLLITIGIAIFYSRKNKTLNSYFKAEGKLPWFVAGTAMVATTFAADTPLAVTEIISKDGISGNWVWWYMALGAVVTVFLFAPLWKRSGVLTDLEFLELRYSGIGAKILRGSKAFYLGGMMNIIIIAWVNLAMYKILQAFLDPEIAVYALLFLFSFAFIYTSLLGLGGISYIDVFQFFFAMVGCVLLAYFSLDLPEIGGLQGLQDKLPVDKFNFFPPEQEWSGYLVLVLVLWWTSWYPGSEPGGGGYIAQRIIASKNEIDASKASLWFLFTHYFLRPWPWIIVALCSLVLFPDLSESDKGKGFILMVEPALEKGGKGFVIATFIAAYLSTIATHLNWGASYLVNDLSKPFIWKNRTDNSYLKLSYFLQFLSGVISLYITFYLMDRVSSAWFFIIEASSGIGFALVFRWFWWRITAWSELSGFVAAPIVFSIIKLTTDIQFPFSAGLTAIITIAIVILVTYLFPSGDRELLKEFYEKVKPSGLGWKKIASEFQLPTYKSNWLLVLQSCFLAIVSVFSGLSGFGKIFFGTTLEIIVYSIVFFLSLIFLKISITKLYSKSYS